VGSKVDSHAIALLCQMISLLFHSQEKKIPLRARLTAGSAARGCLSYPGLAPHLLLLLYLHLLRVESVPAGLFEMAGLKDSCWDLSTLGSSP